MSNVVISIENLSKKYRLGQINTGTLTHDLKQWWARRRGNVDQYRIIGAEEESDQLGESIWAIKDVNLQVQQGEVLGIIGQNGAGKSTLLKILSEVTAPTAGEVKIKGRIASLLEVGTGFHPDLTGRENTYLNGAILGMSRREVRRKFDEIVDFAGIEKFIDTPVKRYSSGMYVRLAFAVAAHLEPEILVVDEVLAVGDAAFQKKCLGKMGDVAAGGRTVMLVSHNMKSIAALARTCILLNEGKIVSSGSATQVIGDYLDQVSTLIPGGGYAEVSTMPRDPIASLRVAQVNWVRLSDAHGSQTGVFRETDPVTIELGFKIKEKTRDLQFGCSFWTMDRSAELFTIPSPEYTDPIQPGDYVVKLHMDPNNLRHGDYTFAVKMFADGQRQDTVGPVIRLAIQQHSRDDDNPAYGQGWVAGYIRYECQWDSIQADGPYKG
jgi:lipopolysaccharide transport system ATP-binding protein